MSRDKILASPYHIATILTPDEVIHFSKDSNHLENEG